MIQGLWANGSYVINKLVRKFELEKFFCKTFSNKEFQTDTSNNKYIELTNSILFK